MTKADKRFVTVSSFSLIVHLGRLKIPLLVCAREDIIMIASEPLTFEQRDWMEVKNNTMVVITPKVSLSASSASFDPKRKEVQCRPALNNTNMRDASVRQTDFDDHSSSR